MANMASRRIVGIKLEYPEGTILEMVAWELDEPVPGSTHRYKYRFYFGRSGTRLIGYDNERGKGDHRHSGAFEDPYDFRGLEQAIIDFRGDVDRSRAANSDADDLD